MFKIIPLDTINSTVNSVTSTLILDHFGEAITGFRKAGTYYGNHYHKGVDKQKNPERYLHLSGIMEWEFIDLNNANYEKITLKEPSWVLIEPNVYHSAFALSDCTFLELNSLESHKADTYYNIDGKKVIGVVATDLKGGIGKDNKLLWHLTDDLKFFKQTTINSSVLMGRKTYDSIGKPLPKRENIVLTRNADWNTSGVTAVQHIVQGILKAENEIVYLIGGGQIYNLAYSLLDELYITKVNTILEADTYFKLDAYAHWNKTIIGEYKAGNGNDFDFTISHWTKS